MRLSALPLIPRRAPAAAALPALAVALSAWLTGPALAKLPAPDEATKAANAEKAAKAAWTGKVAAWKLCQSQDQVAERYRSGLKAQGKPVPEAVAAGSCTDPGPFVYVAPPPAPPLEAAGAHSPAKTATQPPNSKVPHAESASAPKS